MVAMGFLITTLSFGAESVARERRRDTWLGLLGTPLSGRDIVRGKVLGSLWRGRDTLAALLALWAAGLASGAVHPLGFLAAVVWLGVSAPLYGAIGVATALSSDRPQWPVNPADWPLTLVASLGMLLLLTVVPMALVSASLFTHEEVQAAAGSGAFPPFDGTLLRPWVGSGRSPSRASPGSLRWRPAPPPTHDPWHSRSTRSSAGPAGPSGPCRTYRRRPETSGLAFLEQILHGLPAFAELPPDAGAPLVDHLVPAWPRGHGEHVGGRDPAPVGRQRKDRPSLPPAPESHMGVLDLPAGEPPLDVEVEPDEGERQPDRLVPLSGVLRRESIDAC